MSASSKEPVKSAKSEPISLAKKEEQALLLRTETELAKLEHERAVVEASRTEQLKIRAGTTIALGGFVLIGAVLGIGMASHLELTALLAATAPVTAMVGTLAGALLGIHVGTAGREKSEMAQLDM